MKAGDTVFLTNCRAYPEASPSDEVKLTGEYILEEFLQREPAAYIPESGWVILPPNKAGENDGYFVPLWEMGWPGPRGFEKVHVQE
jgi:hypothetical protein